MTQKVQSEGDHDESGVSNVNVSHLALSRTFQMGSWCMSTSLSTHTFMRHGIVEDHLMNQSLLHPEAGPTGTIYYKCTNLMQAVRMSILADKPTRFEDAALNHACRRSFKNRFLLQQQGV
jgi:hypothetical protein